MKLNKNSLNAKLYCWFYGVGSYELPSNLCPYFWKLVLAWILVLPYGLLCTPFILTHELFDKTYKNGQNTFGERVGISVIMYIMLFALFALGVGVGALFTTYAKGSIFLNVLPGSILLWIALVGIGIYQGIKALIVKLSETKKVYDEHGYRVYPEKKPNLAVEFVKAKYNKYCPKITWTTEKDE